MAESCAPLFLIAGGRGMERIKGPDPLIQEVVRSTGVARPKVAYVGAASGDNPAFRLIVAKILQKAGAGVVTLAPLCGRRGSLERALPVMEAADLIFISGGDVEEGMRVLEQKGAAAHLARLQKEGKRFFGISAGSIMLAARWVRWTDPHDDGSAELFPCLGFAPVLCDTHGEGEGWTELTALLALSPVGATGYGIVSGSALVVHGKKVSALGGEIHVFRKRKSGVARLSSLRPGGPGRK
jgi:cyanophycinase-like exopeptidase